MHVLGYAGDIDVTGRTLLAVRKAFIALERAGRGMGLRRNEKKNTCLLVKHVLSCPQKLT
jgi:hypothetical protein